jgi:putative spermidine/putrescine transport system permease protein
MIISRNVGLYKQWGAASGGALLVCVFTIFMIVGRVIPLDRMLGQR